MKLSLLRRTSHRITFTCRPEDEGVITPPVRAKTVMPKWFRDLPPVSEDKISPSDSGLTVKRCMPFLDALMAGWVIGLPATVRMEIADGGRTVNCGWDFDRTLVSNHAAHQVAGNPRAPLPPCKFHNSGPFARWTCFAKVERHFQLRWSFFRTVRGSSSRVKNGAFWDCRSHRCIGQWRSLPARVLGSWSSRPVPISTS